MLSPSYASSIDAFFFLCLLDSRCSGETLRRVLFRRVSIHAGAGADFSAPRSMRSSSCASSNDAFSFLCLLGLSVSFGETLRRVLFPAEAVELLSPLKAGTDQFVWQSLQFL